MSGFDQPTHDAEGRNYLDYWVFDASVPARAPRTVRDHILFSFGTHIARAELEDWSGRLLIGLIANGQRKNGCALGVNAFATEAEAKAALKVTIRANIEELHRQAARLEELLKEDT